MADYLITIGSDGNPSPNPLSCGKNDKLYWKNDYTASITTFTLPTCVSPQTSPAPIAVGGTTIKFQINSGKGSFDYSYGWPSTTRGTRTGTIDVGDK